MNFRISKKDLLEPLEQVYKAVNDSISVEVMRGILFILSNNGLKLIGSDTKITIIRTIPAEKLTITRLGSIVLPAKRVVDIIKALPAGDIDINLKGLSANITAGGTEIKMSGQDRDEYTFRAVKAEESISLSGEDLRSLIKRTSYASTNDKGMPILSGIRVMTEEGRISFTTCDRDRVSKVWVNAPVDFERQFVISADHLDKVRKLFTDTDTVSVSFSENQAIFSTDDTTIYCRILEGNYPSIESLLNFDNTTIIEVETEPFLQALERIKIISVETGKKKLRYVYININEKTIRMFGKSEYGRVDESIPLVSFKGMPSRIALNAQYIIDAVNAVEFEDITLRIGKHAYFSNGDENEAFFQVTQLQTREEEWE